MNMFLEYMYRNYCVLYPWKCIGRFNVFCVSKSYNKNKFKNKPHHISIVRCCHDNILFMLFIFHCVPPSCRWSTSLRALNIQFSWKMHNYYCIWRFYHLASPSVNFLQFSCCSVRGCSAAAFLPDVLHSERGTARGAQLCCPRCPGPRWPWRAFHSATSPFIALRFLMLRKPVYQRLWFQTQLYNRPRSKPCLWRHISLPSAEILKPLQ